MPARQRIAAARSRIFAILAIGATVALASTASASAACPDAESVAGDVGQGQLEASLLCLINERRASSGLAPVVENQKLRAAAVRHSGEMVREGFFAHTSPSGRSFIDRIVATGYTRRSRSWIVGENLVWGSRSLSSPAMLFEAWMESPPHRANIMRGRFREIGIGAVRGTPEDDSDGSGITVSSDFGSRTKIKPRKRRRI
jgi:uncharacterized protein YkwD